MATRVKAKANASALQNEHWGSTGFWQDLAPSLHIVDLDYLTSTEIFDVDPAFAETLRRRMLVEGYFDLPPPRWDLPLGEMAALMTKLDALGIPQPFAFVFDEFWLLFVKLGRLIETQLGPNFFRLPDFWAWFIDPTRTGAGWTPHRDKGYYTLREDRTPKSVSIWIPLSEANTLNGCMYLVPADRDPTYGTPNDREWKFAYPDVRALPASAGTIFMWNQAVLHWGSRGNPRETRPRISVSVEFQAGDVPPFNQPLMAPNQVPVFEVRLKLIAKQILQYQHMYALAPEVRAIAEQMLGR